MCQYEDCFLYRVHRNQSSQRCKVWTWDFGVAIKGADFETRVNVREKVEMNQGLLNNSVVLCFFFFFFSTNLCWKNQSIHEQTVSLGSMPYSCLFDSCVQAKVGPSGC